MWGAPSKRKPTFFWQGLLIILPVAVMSAVGLLAIRRDRAAVEEEARRGADQLVNQLALALANRVPSQLAAYDHFSDAWYKYHWELARGPRSSRQTEAYSTQLREWQSTYPGLDPQMVLPNRLGFNRDGGMIWPPDYAEPPQTPPWVILLTAQQRQAWDVLSKAQYTDSSFTNLQSLVAEFLETKPSPEARANAEFISVRARTGYQTVISALQTLEPFAERCRGFRSESGLPLMSLVEDMAFRAIRQSPQPRAIFRMDPDDRGGYLGEVIGWALDEPSLLTPRFLRELDSLFPENSQAVSQFRPNVQSALTLWNALERLHEVGELAHRRSFLPSENATNFWLNSLSGSWFCRVSPGEMASPGHSPDDTQLLKTNSVLWMRLYPKTVIDSAISRAIREAGVSIPEYVGLEVQLESELLGLAQRRALTLEVRPEPAPWTHPDRPWRVNRTGRYYLTGTLDGTAGQSTTRILAQTSGRFAALPISWSSDDATFGQTDPFPQFTESMPPAEFKVQVALVDPELLFSQQRQRTWLFGGLILASTLAACVGLAAAYRAFRRQLRLNELKSNFVSSVSHELRAPIASVRLMAESLERGKIVETTKQHEYFRFIVQECRRLSSLIENVLDFSRIEQGRKQFEFEPIDIVALTTQTVNLMQAYATERQVALTLAIGDKVVSSQAQLTADGKAVQQALINLIDNAVKHSPKGQTVTVGLEVRSHGCGKPDLEDTGRGQAKSSVPGRLALWVEDHGEGIPAEEHGKIFERFYRLGSELRRETQGVGIGLSIVKHVVEAHNGRVLVDSTVGKGSRFTIELPLGKEKSAQAQT
ncbi:MAG TPA: ATP-binding protein [Verrucomicrobiae bacterium]|nr:ATP-binding protein [Verrucomicrobiae bacterium]